MKKTISIISAIAASAAILLSSCTKQEMPVAKSELTYNFSIGEKDSYGLDTKAVKTGWAEGDKIYIVFDDACPTSSADFLILKYTSGAWTVEQTPATAPTNASGTLDALYYENSNPKFSFSDGLVWFESSGNYGKYMYLDAEDASYTLSGTTLSASISMSLMNSAYSSVQFCVTGLSGDWSFGIARGDLSATSGLWTVQTPKWSKTYGAFSESGIGTFNSNNRREMTAKSDGHYIYPTLYNNSYSSSYTWTIKLTNSTYGTWTKDFTKTIAAKGAVKLSGPTNLTDDAADHNGWTKQ